MKIFGWAADNTGPAFYRLRVPLNALAQHGGHEVLVDTTMPDWALEEADVIVGQRVCQPGSAKRWKRLADGVYGRRPLMVFEIDDDLWDIDPSNTPAWNFFMREPGVLDRLTESVRLADVVTVSTEPLADVVRKINPNVAVLPNMLPAPAFTAGIRNALADPGNGGVRIGWGGGVSHELDMAEAVGALAQHFRRRPQDTFVNMGTLFPSVIKSVRESLEVMDWTTSMTEHYTRLATLDIGIAPLRPSVFNRSKSDIKVLEYGAAGVAPIASDHGPYSIAEGAVKVRMQHEWGKQLAYYASNHEARSHLAALAEQVARGRRIVDHWQSWEAVYGW